VKQIPVEHIDLLILAVRPASAVTPGRCAASYHEDTRCASRMT